MSTVMLNRSAVLVLVSSVLLTSLAACDNQEVGTIVGAAGGAAAGRAIGGSGTGGYVGLVLGALAGGYLGSQVAQWMTEKDKQKLSETTNQTLSGGAPGKPYAWTNPDSGNSGSVTAQPTYKNETGTVCRDFSSSVTSAKGEQVQGKGTACKNPDGTWSIIKSG